MKTMNPILKSAIILVAVLVTLAVFGVYMTHLTVGVDQAGLALGEDFNGNAARQALCVVVMYLMGWLLLWPFKARLGQTQVYLLSYLVGLLSFEYISTFLIVFGIRYTYSAVMAIYLVLVTVIYIWAMRAQKTAGPVWFEKNQGWMFVFWLIGTTAMAVMLSFVPINMLSFDSVEYMNLGRMYATKGVVQDYFIYQMSGHPFVPTLINSLGVFFGFDYAYALQNMFMVMCTLLFGYLIHSEILRQGFKAKTSLWLAMLATALLAVNFFYLFLGITLVPNLFAAFTLFFAAVYMHRYQRDLKTQDVVLSFIFMLAFCFSRVEGPILAAVVMAYFAHQNIERKQLVVYTGGLFVAVALWYLSFHLIVPEGFSGEFLTTERSVLVIAAFLLIELYIFIKDQFFSKYNRLLFGLFMGALFIGSLVLGLLDIPKYINNLTVIYQNVFYYGFWKFTWLVILALTIVALLITKKREMFLEWVIPIIFAFTLAIFALREAPLHINWSDSGNRMFFHLYPFCIFVLVLNILSYFAPNQSEE